MASLKIVNDHYYIRYYDPLIKGDRRISLHLEATNANKPLANRKLKEFKMQMMLSESPLSNMAKNVYFSDVLEQYYSGKELSAHTIELTEYATKHFIKACGNKRLFQYNSMVINKELRAYFGENGLSHNTQAIYRAHLHSIFSYFCEKKLINENPIEMLTKKKKVVKTISIEDKEKLLAYLKAKTEYPEQYRIIFFLFNTGARISDALALKRGDIDFKNEMIMMTNVKKKRKYPFPLTARLCAIFLSTPREPEEKEFAFSGRSSLHFLKRACEELGIPVMGLHQIRKTFSTILYNNNVSSETRRVLLNHTSEKTTEENYTQYSNDSLKDALKGLNNVQHRRRKKRKLKL